MRKVQSSVATMALLLTVAAGAQAQQSSFSPNSPRKTYRSAYQRPATSPYLNLLREDVPTAINYHALVRPLVHQENVNTRDSANVARLKNQVSAEERAIDPRGGSPSVRPTGQRGRFMDYSSHYFRTPQ
jgi:hypothetical protein